MGMQQKPFEIPNMETVESNANKKKEVYSCGLKRKGLSITSKINRIKERQNDKLLIKRGC